MSLRMSEHEENRIHNNKAENQTNKKQTQQKISRKNGSENKKTKPNK